MKILFLIVMVSILVGNSNSYHTDRSNQTQNSSSTKIDEKIALEKINKLIGKGKIELEDPNCEVQYFFKNAEGFHVIRIAFVDPNHPDSTTTTARYLVAVDSGEVFEEDLFSGELTKIIEE